jgi:GNAT superfamily N-acetyltransferase
MGVGADGIVVTSVDLEDDAALDELLAFGWRHGRPRAKTAVGYREVTFNTDARIGFVARRTGGPGLCAAALPTITAAIGLDQVQLNAFLAPGDQAAFDAVLARVADWAREQSATHVTAHVSAPSDEDLAAWRAAGYEQVGERTRVVRAVTYEDATTEPVEVAGVRIVALVDHPELEAGAEALWRASHEDVPSALRFDSADLPAMRDELQLATDEPMPSLVLVAVADDDEVVGLGVGLRRFADRPDVVGHRMTATARGWRGRGVARALKVEQLRRAAREGVTLLEASNDSGNAPMQAINERLGYQPEYRLVLMRRAVG